MVFVVWMTHFFRARTLSPDPLAQHGLREGCGVPALSPALGYEPDFFPEVSIFVGEKDRKRNVI